jgi:transcriptional regulator with XRE-family HTH domain
MPVMADQRIYLRQWRKHRGLTQEQVVNRLAIHEDDKMPATAASLSRLENGKQPFTPRILEALADIYSCETWELIGRDPTKEGVVIDMVRRLDEQKQAQVAAFIRGLEAG